MIYVEVIAEDELYVEIWYIFLENLILNIDINKCLRKYETFSCKYISYNTYKDIRFVNYIGNTFFYYILFLMKQII